MKIPNLTTQTPTKIPRYAQSIPNPLPSSPPRRLLRHLTTNSRSLPPPLLTILLRPLLLRRALPPHLRIRHSLQPILFEIIPRIQSLFEPAKRFFQIFHGSEPPGVVGCGGGPAETLA